MAYLTITFQLNREGRRAGVLRRLTVGTARQCVRIFVPNFDPPAIAEQDIFLIGEKHKNGKFITKRERGWGDERVGMLIQDFASEYHRDGSPRYHATFIEVYGLPEEYSVKVESTYDTTHFTKRIDLEYPAELKSRVETVIRRLQGDYATVSMEQEE